MLSVGALGLLVVGLYLIDALLVCDPGDIVIVGWRPGAAHVRKGLEVSLGRPRLISWGRLLPPLDPPIVISGGRLDARAAAILHARMIATLQRLRVLANLLFMSVFVLLPAAVLAPYGWFRARHVFALIAICWLAVALAAMVAVRRVYPEAESRPSLTAALLSPISAIRVVDVLAKRLLAEWHPVVVAKLLCPRTDYLALARVASFAATESDAAPVVAFLRAAGDWKAVEAPPDVEAGCTSYCPACHAQFRQILSRCSDCRVPVVAHEPAATMTAVSLSLEGRT